MTQSLLTQPCQSQYSRQPGGFSSLNVIDLGLIGYCQAFDFQLDTLEKRIQGKLSDTLILCEHLPVFTSGRLAKRENILVHPEELKRNNLEVIPINRGGDVTFHGPGQLVVYPIFDLKNYKKDLRLFLNSLEQVIIEFLKSFDCLAYREKSFTGVWLDNEKIASIGIGVKKWVSFHGLAVNLNTDLRYFSMIKPCGLSCRMISLEKFKGYKIDMDLAKKIIAEKFKEVFQIYPLPKRL